MCKEISIKNKKYLSTFQQLPHWNEIKILDQEKNECGYVSFIKSSDGFPSIWIYRIEVIESQRFKGIGQKLLEMVESFAFQNSIDYVEGIFHPTNEYAEKFYLKNGYEIRREGYETIIFKDISLKNNRNFKSKTKKNYSKEK